MAEELLHSVSDIIDVDRSRIIRFLLKEKLEILSDIDEKILELCDVKDIGQEIEETAEIGAGILITKQKLENALKSNTSKVINEKNGEQQSQDTAEHRSSNMTHSMNIDNGEQSNDASQSETTMSQSKVNMSQSITMTSATTNVKPKLPKLTLPKFKRCDKVEHVLGLLRVSNTQKRCNNEGR